MTASITWTRGDRTLAVFPTPGSAEAAGEVIRVALDVIHTYVRIDDVLRCDGEADFGYEHALYLPECCYAGGQWLTRCKVDAQTVGGVVTKPGATPGFVVGAYASFDEFAISGDCVNKGEDGGLIGWSGNGRQDGVLEFNRCVVDASRGMDWAVYAGSNSKRTIRFLDSEMRYCRQGISAYASGAIAHQTVEVSGSKFIGDASGSTSFGETSRNDVDTGGVLAAIVNRSGNTWVRDSAFTAKGLKQEYDTRKLPPDRERDRWTVPRIACIGTNRYFGNAGTTTWTIEGNVTSTIDPGTAKEWYDLDLRGTAGTSGLSIVPQRVGSAEDGSFKRWVAPVEVGK